MMYENIEPPTLEVDTLYREIVADYKAGKYSSQDEALSILESQYFFSFIEIKEVMSKDFESYPFYRWGTGGIDEYIKVCEKSETSLSSKERDIYVGIINGIIKGIQKSDEEGDEPELMRSYEKIAQQVYMQVEKVRSICRKNRESKELYEKYKSEIAGSLCIPQQTEQNELKEKIELASKADLMVVFSLYRQFQHDYKTLKNNGYITETAENIENSLKWEKSKVALAQYFGIHLHPKTADKNRIPWKEIETLFGEQDLKNSFHTDYKKPSKDFLKLQEILSSTPDS